MSQQNSFEAQNESDSFDVNLKQIEQTNKILNNIESKLSNFFKPKPETTNYSQERQPNDKYSRPSQLKYPSASNLLATSLSPIENKSPLKYEAFPSFNKKQTGAIKVEENDSGQQYTFQEDYQNLNYKGYGESEKQEPTSNFAPQQSISSTITNRMLKNGDQLEGELNIFKNRLVAIERDMKTQQSQNLSHISQKNTSSDNIVSRLSQMEDFYQNRTRILEERIGALEKENYQLYNEKCEVVNENKQLRQELNEQRAHFLQEMQNTLREQQERLGQQFELNLRSLSSQNKQVLKEQTSYKEFYSKQLDDLKKEKAFLVDELERVQQKNVNLEDEKGNISKTYTNLVNLHNQMLEMDIVKNEQKLQESFNQSISIDQFHQSNGAGDSGLKQHLQHQQKLGLDPDNINQDKNLQFNQHMKGEIRQLREELDRQKMENFKLVEELQNMQSGTTSLENSQKRYNQRSSSAVRQESEVPVRFEETNPRNSEMKQQKITSPVQRDTSNDKRPESSAVYTNSRQAKQAADEREDLNQLYQKIFKNQSNTEKMEVATENTFESRVNTNISPTQLFTNDAVKNNLSSHGSQSAFNQQVKSATNLVGSSSLYMKPPQQKDQQNINLNSADKGKQQQDNKQQETQGKNTGTPGKTLTKKVSNRKLEEFEREVKRLQQIVIEQIQEKKDTTQQSTSKIQEKSTQKKSHHQSVSSYTKSRSPSRNHFL